MTWAGKLKSYDSTCSELDFLVKFRVGSPFLMLIVFLGDVGQRFGPPRDVCGAQRMNLNDFGAIMRSCVN